MVLPIVPEKYDTDCNKENNKLLIEVAYCIICTAVFSITYCQSGSIVSSVTDSRVKFTVLSCIINWKIN